MLSAVTMLGHDARLFFEPEYDRDADVLYIVWGEQPTTHGVELEPGVVVRFTHDNVLEGLTLYDVTRRFPFDPAGDLVSQAGALATQLLSRLPVAGLAGPDDRPDLRS